MPTVFEKNGNRFFFFSNEGCGKPHIHVAKAENHAKFSLNPVALVKSKGYNSTEIRRLRELVEEKREYFVEKWYGFFGTEKD